MTSFVRRLMVTIVIAVFFAEGRSEAVISRSVLYQAGEGGFYTYRIASMVATKQGSLLAFAAARKGTGGDWDPINIVMRRSLDGGKSWEPMRIVVQDGEQPCDNAMPITDYITGEVHLLYQIDYARCFYTKYSDEGATW